MAIREDIVSSGVSFLQDPNVASSSVESKIAFLRSKNLTQEEIDAAFARAAGVSPPPSSSSITSTVPAQQHIYHPPQYQQPSPYGWQPPPPQPPKRDWRDWFIMATVVGGVGYGLYFMSKQYLYPLVAPPTPEKLDQDKASVDEQFDKAFATLEQLAKDTESLKASESARTEKLDKVLEDLETFVRDTKSSTRRQEDETDFLRDAVKKINTNIPKSLALNNEITEAKLKDISNEVKSLKSLIQQRMNAAPAPALPPIANPAVTNPTGPTGPPASSNSSTSNLRPSTSNVSPANPASPAPSEAKETGSLKVVSSAQDENKTSTSTSAPSKQDYISSLGGRSSPFGSHAPPSRASIPAWQMAANAKASANGATNNSSPTEASP
ncbi:hypothetical protein GGS21DRAFT_512748 [Xylaria nigripes]|nr:hypothetical protein GGS21DRAFT_512748 [Xylaria nigripes]